MSLVFTYFCFGSLVWVLFAQFCTLTTQFWLLRPPPSSFSCAVSSTPGLFYLPHQHSALCLAAWIPASLGLSSLTSLPLASSSCLCSVTPLLPDSEKQSIQILESLFTHPSIASLVPTTHPPTAFHPSPETRGTVGLHDRLMLDTTVRNTTASPRHSVPCSLPRLYWLLGTYCAVQKRCV